MLETKQHNDRVIASAPHVADDLLIGEMRHVDHARVKCLTVSVQDDAETRTNFVRFTGQSLWSWLRWRRSFDPSCFCTGVWAEQPWLQHIQKPRTIYAQA